MASRPISIIQQRWLDFYDLDSPQRLVYLIRYAPGLPPRPLPNPELKAQRLEWIWLNYLYFTERMDWLADDTLPCLDLLTGTEIFAEAFGCPVHRPPDNNPFALPCVRSAAEAGRLAVPTLDAPPLALVFELADELARRAGPQALFRLVDLQSPMDVAALIWEKSDFYAALLTDPPAVFELVEKVKALQFAFLDEWFCRYGRQCIAHYPEYYMPQGVTLSVDEIGVVSGKLFQQYFLPELQAFSLRYGGLGMHCCANARHQWAHFKQIPNLRLLNLNQPGRALIDAYPYFARFTCQWHYDQSLEPRPPLDWLAELPKDVHLVVDVTAQSKDEALRLADQLGSLA